MSQESQTATTGPHHDRVEIGLATVIVVFGAIIVYGATKAGIAWGLEGPRAGFLPFYIGLLIILSGGVSLVQAFRNRSDKLFARWTQLGQVLSVVLPASVYVAVISRTGIYVASAGLIAFFMKRFGRYGWPLTLAISLGVPIATFMVFEWWFLVPLPKGPLEDSLGY